MASIAQVIQTIEKFAPKELSESFDNCGLKIGEINNIVTGVLVTVDTNLDVIKEAEEFGCNLIVEHHPSIWQPLRSFDLKLPLNQAILEAGKNNIAIYSAHTNVDYTTDGLNDIVAASMGLGDVRPVGDYSSARIGSLKKDASLKDYAILLSKVFDDDNISVVGDLNKNIKNVAVINGGGGGCIDSILDTFNAGADVFVTGDVKHSVARLAKDLGYGIIQVGHFTSEKAFLPLMKKVINKEFPDLNVIESEIIGSPYNRREEIWI